MLPPLMCSLANTEHAELRVQAIAFLHVSSLWHSLFSGVFMRIGGLVFFCVCFICHQNSFTRIGNKTCILCPLYLCIFWSIYFWHKSRSPQIKKPFFFAYLPPFRKASTFSTTVYHTRNSYSDKFLLSCVRLLRLELRSKSDNFKMLWPV